MRATSLRLDDTTLARLDALAQTTGKSRSQAMAEAIEEYLERNEWFLTAVDEGLRDLDEGRVATHEEVAAAFRTYGVSID